MPDAPPKPFDEKAIAQDKEDRKKSPPYRGVHPTVKVYDFVRLKGDYLAQRRIDREAEEMQAGLRQWVKKTDTKPAHWLVKKGNDWAEEPA